MQYLRYKTIGDTSPQGKPRVFFACHPNDFSLYSDTIFREILGARSCAIYYMENAEEDEDLYSDLSHMQLFVFAVSRRLLTEPSLAMDKLFPYAEKNNIPVLPLMQESNLDELFAKRFGDLHYLDRAKISATSIGYEEQLSKYLTSVLVDDKLSAEVRKAFDAYIFLSYRKKDRKHAQELMHLIHKNEFCRDVAIWYDEFLIPGENFNTSIGEMLSKCDLFALAVTPNLINEKNYVMTTEYPNAVTQNKKILAAEMVATDRKELEKNYSGLPKCTDPRNQQQLLEALQDALSTIARQERDSSPKHLYYIGLAYLAGIDVEVDHERATTLITKSAEAGNSDAIRKLVSMYRNGEGVGRSYKTALIWQKKLVELWEKFYSIIPEVRKTTVYQESLQELADLYHDMQDYVHQKETLETLLGLCEDTKESWGPGYRLIATDMLANLCYEQGDYPVARQHFLNLNEQCRKLLEAKGSTASVTLAGSYLVLGEIDRRDGNSKSSQEYYLKALKVADEYKDRHSFTSVRLLGLRYLSRNAREAGRLEEAQEYLNKLRSLYENLQSTGVDVTGGLANLNEEQNSLQSQLVYNRDLDKTYQKFRQEMSMDPNQSRADFLNLIKQLETLRDSKETNVDYSETVNKRRELLRAAESTLDVNSQEIEDQHKLAAGYMLLANLERAAGQFSAAKDDYDKALAFFRTYMQEKRTENALSEVLAILVDYAYICDKNKNKEDAHKYYREACKYGEEILELRGNARDYELVARTYLALALFEDKNSLFDEARKNCRQGIRLAEKLVQLNNTRGAQELLIDSWYQLGYVNGNVAPDKYSILEAYKLCYKLSEQYPGDASLSMRCSKIQFVLMRCNMTFSEINAAVTEKIPKKGFFSNLFKH